MQESEKRSFVISLLGVREIVHSSGREENPGTVVA
jgi:hypothetical protein